MSRHLNDGSISARQRMFVGPSRGVATYAVILMLKIRLGDGFPNCIISGFRALLSSDAWGGAIKIRGVFIPIKGVFKGKGKICQKEPCTFEFGELYWYKGVLKKGHGCS